LLNDAFSAAAGAERVIEILDQRPEVEEPAGARDLARSQGQVRFEAVTFAYPGKPRPALDEVTFDVSPGEIVALVGASGAGKSTASKLLLRFYDPASGRVLLDGNDIREVSLSSLRRNVAVVFQETLVLDGTIRDNIAYGRPDATEDEIIAAARAADAHDFISELPDGYLTQVGERGRRLSGGQGQRIAIARAMLRDAPVLLLDEPTTGLDAVSADRVMAPLRRLMAGRATLVISHNLMTVREATQILVLDHGKIVERGRHDDLRLAGGHYAQLLQAAGPDSDGAAMQATTEAGDDEDFEEMYDDEFDDDRPPLATSGTADR
jgi:ABC-type multidrug transport system fused ATPase/permease subunit